MIFATSKPDPWKTNSTALILSLPTGLRQKKKKKKKRNLKKDFRNPPTWVPREKPGSRDVTVGSRDSPSTCTGPGQAQKHKPFIKLIHEIWELLVKTEATLVNRGFPGGASGKESAYQNRRLKETEWTWTKQLSMPHPDGYSPAGERSMSAALHCDQFEGSQTLSHFHTPRLREKSCHMTIWRGWTGDRRIGRHL